MTKLTNFILVFLLSTSFLFSQSLVNLAFETDSDPTKLNVVLKLSFDQAGELGGGNLRFDFDENVLASPTLLEHYLMDNGEGYFSILLVETQQNGNPIASLDITLFPGSDGFDVPAGIGNEVPIALVQFDIIDSGAEITDLTWQPFSTNAGDSNLRTENFVVLAAGNIENAQSLSLPVEFKEFDVKALGENGATLDWSTASEIDFSHFEIERSFEGRTWDYISTVKGKANNYKGAEYTYNDENILLPRTERPIVYYRIKMVDKNGDFDYTETRSVEFEASDVTVEVFPNPTTEYVTVQANEEISNISIFDVDGKLVIDQDYNDSKIDLSRLNSGMYRILISTTSGISEKSIIKID